MPAPDCEIGAGLTSKTVEGHLAVARKSVIFPLIRAMALPQNDFSTKLISAVTAKYHVVDPFFGPLGHSARVYRFRCHICL